MQHHRAKLVKNMPFVIAVLATFVVLLLFVGKPIPIVIWDEGRIIANAMEMRQNGFSLITTYNYQPDLWNTKPPLLVWLMTGSMALFGPSELALRVPSLISSLGTILMVMLFLRHITRSVPIAVFGGLSLAASVGFFGEHGARTGDYDALLCFFTAGYILLLFFAIHRQRPPLRWLFLAGALAAGALMTKSVAGAVPAAGFLIYVMLTGRWRRLFITPRYIAAAAFAIFPIIGFLALREYADPGYLNAMIYNDVTGRFNEALDDHSGPPWYYLEATFVHGLFSLGMAALIAPFALPLAHGKTRLALSFALCITIGHLVIVTISSTKLQHYYLSSLPFIAIAAALAVHAALNHVQALAAAGGLSPLRLTIIRLAPALLLLAAMAQAAQIRINVLDPRVDYPSARYGALLDALADQRAPILLVDRGWKVPNDPHYAPELRYYAMVARENGRDVEQTGDVSQIASAAAGTIVASCEPPVTAFLLEQMRKRLLEHNGCVAGWKDA